MPNDPRVRKSAFLVVAECKLPKLPDELREAVANAMGGMIEFGDAGDATELVVRFDNKEDAIELAERMDGSVYRIGPKVWPT